MVMPVYRAPVEPVAAKRTSVYAGEMVDGKRQGWGKATTAEGIVYEGFFVADVPCGQGSISIEDHYYEGEVSCVGRLVSITGKSLYKGKVGRGTWVKWIEFWTTDLTLVAILIYIKTLSLILKILFFSFSIFSARVCRNFENFEGKSTILRKSIIYININ